MAEGDSPTVARRRVRLALREAREAADGDLSSAVMYRETGVTDEILEDIAIGRANATGPPPPGPVARHYDRYQKLWNAAANEDDTIAFIEKRIRELG